MSIVHIATDQHHRHGMERMIQQFGLDQSYRFLGDITPYDETIDFGGKSSPAKKRLKELGVLYPHFTEDQLLGLYITEDLELARERYGKAIPYTKERLDFLNENNVYVRSIAGNMEYIMDYVLRLLQNLTCLEGPTSLELIRASPNLELNEGTVPYEYREEATTFYEIPYSSSFGPNGEFQPAEAGNILILTHENPHSAGVGIEREAKMQASLDSFIDAVRDRNPESSIALACGHLHASGKPYMYRKIKIVPIAPDEVMLYNCAKGTFDIVKADNH